MEEESGYRAWVPSHRRRYNSIVVIEQLNVRASERNRIGGYIDTETNDENGDTGATIRNVMVINVIDSLTEVTLNIQNNG